MSAPAIPQRILITGGSGFLGQYFISRVLDEGREIVSLGRTRGGLDGRIGFLRADLSDPASLRAALSRLRDERPFDAIVHLAVSRHHREFPQKALDLFHVNSTAAAEILEFARETGASSAVFASTGTVYSPQSSSDGGVGGGDSEATFRRPSSYFAASKLFADTMAELYRSFLPVAVLRLYAPYGPGLTGRMLNDLVARVGKGIPINLPARGPGLGFAALYVDDALDLISQALDASWSATVNAASPEVWTIESAGRLIGSIVGREPIFERSTENFAPRIVPSLTRLNELMPGRQYVGLEEGLRRMIAAG